MDSVGMFTGELGDAAFGARFEVIQAKRDQFNRDFKNQIDQTGARGFRPYIQSQEDPQLFLEQSSIESTGQVHPRLLENLMSSRSSARNGRVVSSPAEVSGFLTSVADSAKRLRKVGEGFKG